ncbi:unnamed protein product [Prorocentrum cordatum]|uniref:Reverse transcriptase domain-containing protein n=1 Tax=Prorocentrum cordatum TaxID=2364126 RepID=A0ABN9S387_9DINO|nr:unnamed protein product [Polarella glacialis]
MAKDDVGALWQQLLSSGQQPSDWTKEQLADAFTQVQNSSLGTGTLQAPWAQARCLGNPPLVSGLLAASAGAKELQVPAAAAITHTFETFNANQGKLTLQKRLRRSTAMVILAHEIGYGIDDCESLSPWATARGWQSLIVPGLPSRGHLPSADLAVFAREGIGLRGPTYPDEAPPRRAGSVNETISHGTELVRGRAQHVVVELPNWPPLNVVNVYLHTGEGMSNRNASLLMTVGLALAGQAHPGIIGGDWNMDVQVVKDSSFPVHAQLEMVTPRHATCRTAASVSTIDYFGLTTGSMRMLAACKADLTWAVKPHRPVQLQLTAEGTKLRYLTYVGGAKIPAQTVHGPFLEESSWSLERSFAEQALKMAKEAPAAVAWRFLSKAWGRWATRAASRLGHLTGTEVRASAYARPLQAKWVEREHQILTDDEVQAIADGWKWLQDCLAGLSTAKANARTPEGRQVLDNEVQGFLTVDYCGQNLSARLDACVRQARQRAQRSFSSEDIRTFSEEIDEDVNFAMQQANKESSRRWKEWCDGACAGGARKLHKATRAREVQAPTTVNDSENGITGHPHFVVKDMEDTHAALWKAAKEAPQARIPDRSTLERPSPEELRRASRTFSITTSSSLDGLHPTHLEHLSDDGLEGLCDIMLACEALGLFPVQLTWMVMPMLPKAAGGHRLIILFSMAYRVWQRLRKPALLPLQEALRRPYWAAAKNRSAIDSAWILAADAEQNAEAGRHTAAIIADYSKYYELIPLDEARDKLLRLGMPLAMVKIVYNQWRGPRVIRLHQHHGAQPRHAQFGLPAGDGYADVVIKAHAIEQYDIYVTLHPLVRFASYIYDTSLGINGATKESVILQAVAAGNAFFNVAKKLGARINDKLAVVASSNDIGKEVVRQLKLPTDMNRTRATYLGTDFAGARRRRGKLLRARQQARHKIYKQRLRKLGRFRHRLPGQQTQRTAKVFRAGARPAATFGVEINGLTDRELHKLRTDFGKFRKPCHGGVSASAKVVLLGDPTVAIAMAPVLQWSRMVWMAVSQPEQAPVPLALLTTWWRRAVEEPGVCSTWGTTRGPLQRAALSLARAGWTATSALRWRNHRGDLVFVEQLTPGLLLQMLQQGVQCQHERDLADKLGLGEGKRATFDILAPLVSLRSKRYTAHQKFCIMNELEQMAACFLRDDDASMEVATDGSCTKPPIKEFQRAGWSLALLGPRSDRPLATMHGAVPASLPQESAVGEHLAAVFVSQGVIHLGNKQKELQLKARTPYACIAHFAQSLDGFKHVQQYAHVKAHRSGDEYAALSDSQRRLTDANIVADLRAKEAAAIHPAPEQKAVEEMQKAVDRISQIARLIAHVMPIFDKDDQIRWTRRAPTLRRAASTRKATWHQWQDGELGAQCSTCLQLHMPGQPLPLTGCPGTPTFLLDHRRNPSGHKLVAVNQKGTLESGAQDTYRPVLICVKCGAWALQRRKAKLRQPCAAATTKGLEVLNNLRRGVGPFKKLKKFIDRTTPLRRLEATSEVHTTFTKVDIFSGTDAAAPAAGFESRMAALHQRFAELEGIGVLGRDLGELKELPLLGVPSSAAADIVEHIAERAAAGAAGAGAPRGSVATFDGSDALDEQYVDALGDDEHDTQAAAAGEALGLGTDCFDGSAALDVQVGGALGDDEHDAEAAVAAEELGLAMDLDSSGALGDGLLGALGFGAEAAAAGEAGSSLAVADGSDALDVDTEGALGDTEHDAEAAAAGAAGGLIAGVDGSHALGVDLEGALGHAEHDAEAAAAGAASDSAAASGASDALDGNAATALGSLGFAERVARLLAAAGAREQQAPGAAAPSLGGERDGASASAALEGSGRGAEAAAEGAVRRPTATYPPQRHGHAWERVPALGDWPGPWDPRAAPSVRGQGRGHGGAFDDRVAVLDGGRRAPLGDLEHDAEAAAAGASPRAARASADSVESRASAEARAAEFKKLVAQDVSPFGQNLLLI